MKTSRRAVEGQSIMPKNFQTAIVFFLFLLFNMACTRDNMLPSLKLNSALTCRLVGGLTREQRAVCREAPDAATIAFEGLHMAVKECQHQFRWHRWNCSSLLVKSSNPHSSALMRRGFRESSFLYALTAAGVAHAVARACAQGRLLSCGCDPLGYRASHDPRGRAKVNKWEWSGCSHNLAYGIEFSRKFLDIREQVDDLQSKINVHNNNAGRSILSSNMEVRCKCHGLSGSCQLRTCWRATPDFRAVASTIKRQYRKALIVAQEELNSGMNILRGRPRGRRRSRSRPAPKTSLLFFEKSPSFCDVDSRVDSAGTSGRVCRVGRTSRTGSCDLLCCGRGHALIRKSSLKPCNCTFHWCCRVDCQRCRDDKWVAISLFLIEEAGAVHLEEFCRLGASSADTFEGSGRLYSTGLFCQLYVPLGIMKDGLNVASLPSPVERYKLECKLGSGIFGQVFKATDTQATGKAVAIKVQAYTDDNEIHIQEEYKILRDFSNHPNLIDFYGVFCDKSESVRNVWFVLELCECGPVIDIVRKLNAAERKMSEEHIAYILKYTIKALVYLHENKVMHRNVRCSNILITKEGEIKVSDFGLSCKLNGTLDKSKTNIGSPSWMAPEVVACGDEGYGNRADVWALGITTIEMADGKAPFQDMHPTRALFQIVRNPPPAISKPAMWSNDINDFISECLEKNPEHRPYAVELEEHPFVQSVPENDFHLSTELKKLIMDIKEIEAPEKPKERIIKNGLLTTEGVFEPETLQVEDLAALEELTEDKILTELQTKLAKGCFTSFVGEVLLILNPNTEDDIYNENYHAKYECKSRSDNGPHIFAVADSGYQDALHHNEPQHIVFSGESKSGKTTNMLHALSHLTHLGAMKNNTAERIQRATKAIQAAITAGTPLHAHSTRGIFQIQVTYGSSGKLSGAIFWLYQLEKWRVSSTDMTQANFDLLYYFYDAMEAEGRLEELSLEKNRKHRYLRVLEEPTKGPKGVREISDNNVENYKQFIENLKCVDWEVEDIVFLETTLAAILVLGNVRFKDSKSGAADIENPEEAKKVAKLLSLEETKFLWALLNYCLIESGTAVKRRHSTDEARDARDTLASALYKRLIDWMINIINSKLSFMRSVFGDKYSVSLLDMFGFECYHRNRLEQLIVNTTNEQIQFLYNQRMFAWEMQETAEEEIPVVSLHFYDNKNSVDQLMGRPLGLFYILDEASRTGSGQEFIMSTIRTSCKGPYIKLSGSHEFSVAHYTGKVNYDCREMADKNKDFLPPEMIETMRASINITVQQLFRNKLTKTGNLTVSPSQPKVEVIKSKSEKEMENLKARKYNTVSRGQFSQVHRMRTAAATYRATSLELLKQLSVGPGSGGTHYVRCVRADLNDNPRGFQREVVRQQIRALAILDTARARQNGYSCRIPFAEFIRRYRFLAFDFDENVEETKENCRLLMIRLKMEGWVLGKSKVFLKYYNEEFLSRLYEIQVKKIVKVQCMMRAFLARRKATKDKAKSKHIKELKKHQSLNVTEDDAALLIQKAYRGYIVRKAYGPLISKTTGQIDEETALFLKRFAMKWKSRSIFQVLLQYRAVRYQDLVHFSQQVHIYNQAVLEALLNTSTSALLDRVDPHAKEADFLGSTPPTVWKLPFRIDQLQYYDTTYMCDPSAKSNDTFASQYDSDHEQWDEPLKRRFGSAPDVTKASASTQTLIAVPFCRDPTQPIPVLPAEDHKEPSPKVTNRPAVYKKKPGAHSTHSYYHPPEPWVHARDDTDILEDAAPKLRKAPQTRSLYAIDTMENDPIKELQAMARSTNDMNEDDPPFNFQAMLKRTPRNRASMKRSGETDSLENRAKQTPRKTKQAPPPPVTKTPDLPRGQTPTRYGQPTPPPPNYASPTPPPSKMRTPTPSSKELFRQDSRDLIIAELKKRDSKPELIYPIIDNKTESEIVQLAPGITVEGTVTDL